jgi:anti-anti-sigma factor
MAAPGTLLPPSPPSRPGKTLMNEPFHPAQPTSTPAGELPPVLALPDEIDYANARVIADKLTAALTPGLPALIIDLTATTFCDSAGIGALARAHSRAAVTGTRVHLAAPPGAVTRILHVTGLDQLWTIHPSLAVALTSAERQS